MHLRWRLKKDASRLVNVFALTSVGMIVIGHLHFFFLFCCVRVEAIGCPLGVLGSSRHFGRWRCMDLVGCQYLKKVGLWNRLTRGVALSQVSAFAFRIY
jgi:hypothetical protein